MREAGATLRERPVFTFDANRCTGCDACRLACTIENELPLDRSWRQVLHFNPRHHPAAPVLHLSIACNHCAHPACLEACPALAYRLDAATGAILVDPGKCMGCRYCTWACPYDAPRFDAAAGVVTKCTFCAHRLREGRIPACASVCPTGALGCATRSAAGAAGTLEGLPQTALAPALRVVPLRAGHAIPAGLAPAERILPGEVSMPPSRITLRSEWSLVAFTLLVTTLVGGIGALRLARNDAALVLPVGLEAPAGTLVWGFAALAASALGMAGAHLGTKRRAWRAVLNVRRSWLAREIAAVALFTGLGTVWLAGRAGAWGVAAGSALEGVGFAALVAGLAALYSIDRVYGYATLPPLARPHSSSALLTGPFLAGLCVRHPGLAVLFGTTKLLFFLRRKRSPGGTPGGVRGRAATALRLLLGFAFPFVLWRTESPGVWSACLLGVLVAEALDRASFYGDLVFLSPQRQMVADLCTRLAAAGCPVEVGPKRARPFPLGFARTTF